MSGEQLDKYTGVAAILRFPLPEIDDTPIIADNIQRNDNEVREENTHENNRDSMSFEDSIGDMF